MKKLYPGIVAVLLFVLCLYGCGSADISYDDPRTGAAVVRSEPVAVKEPAGSAEQTDVSIQEGAEEEAQGAEKAEETVASEDVSENSEIGVAQENAEDAGSVGSEEAIGTSDPGMTTQNNDKAPAEEAPEEGSEAGPDSDSGKKAEEEDAETENSAPVPAGSKPVMLPQFLYKIFHAEQ